MSMHPLLRANSSLTCRPSTGRGVRTEGARESPVSENARAARSEPGGNGSDAREHVHRVREERLPASSAAQREAPGSGETPELAANAPSKIRQH